MTGTWWRDGVLYQIYTRSYADSNGDGVGDLEGIRSRLDYLSWLGVDGIWLTPVTPSPNDDWGYDVSDYCGVDPDYGTLDDMDRLIADASDRGIRVLGDLVPNHSSDRHPWFIESRSSRTNPKRDWYVWADPARDGGPPNNWVSSFFGPAWTFDETSGQYYLHSFLESQCDLNWRNPGVREAFHDILRFWFDRGVAGLRLDVCHKLVKDAALRDNPPATDEDSFIERVWGQRELYTTNQPETHEVLRGWRRVADEYQTPRVLIGETYVFDLDALGAYYGTGDELHLAFNIPFLWTPFDGGPLRGIVESTLRALPEHAWPVWNGGSHDISRMASRWGTGDGARIRCALMLLLTLRGTPLLYYGDEIGMPDAPIAPGDAKDPLGRRAPVATAGRDPARTPMQWSRRDGGGFTGPAARPWLPVGDVAACNVEDQRADPGSVVHLCRDLIAARRDGDDLRTGALTFIDAAEGILAYTRGSATLVALNVSGDERMLPDVTGSILIATDRARDGERVTGTLQLPPWSGAVVRA